eukprot:scaffold132030_cov27-Tisochrysis_lutea.AAC.1
MGHSGASRWYGDVDRRRGCEHQGRCSTSARAGGRQGRFAWLLGRQHLLIWCLVLGGTSSPSG